ncbi:hypothetical protein [Lysinibacillus odysseyi]|uniref:SMI1/KNR4 family protein n=1 Tax=Lysinibacillus odysseyi 34hs-1 = NBRC 100172 TaxID=1220589 RepID=A0A0A3IQF4_9BACI|nr:hypothetical protein [Lysinibacillus odysseyi]KGR86994.1 hypothetical protein CD32_04450 [Lysinibacillus odysseyi 34hs-1 = NBRC 100172]
MSTIKFDSFHQREEIKRELNFIKLEHEIMKDFVDFEIFSFDELDEYQIGYSIDLNGNSLVTDEADTWDDSWVVIGYETLCGDPIIIELNEAGYPVSRLMHGMGSWNNGTFLADSIKSFLSILKDIRCFLTEKQMLQGKKMIQHKELKVLVNSMIEKNKTVDFEIWEALLQPLFDMAEEYEETLKAKIEEMKREGRKITEIAGMLSIQPKDVYEYSKKS